MKIDFQKSSHRPYAGTLPTSLRNDSGNFAALKKDKM